MDWQQILLSVLGVILTWVITWITERIIKLIAVEEYEPIKQRRQVWYDEINKLEAELLTIDNNTSSNTFSNT